MGRLASLLAGSYSPSIFLVSFKEPFSFLQFLITVAGYNTTVTVRTHEGTIPGLPKLGKALSKLGLEVQIPRVPVPHAPGTGDDPDDDPKGFIQGATVLSTFIDIVLEHNI